MRILFSLIVGAIAAYFIGIISIRLEIWLLEPEIPTIGIFIMPPIGFIMGAIIGYKTFIKKQQ